MRLMRHHLYETICEQNGKEEGCLKQNLKEPHAGLMLQRGLSAWEDGDKQKKQKLLGRIGEIHTAPPLYQKAYERWLTYTADETRFAFTAAKIIGRLYTGLSSATALETGMTTHHTYGMPMIAGSSIKGAVSAFAEQIGVEPKFRAVLFGNDEDGVDESGKNEASSGAVIWHDAWWIPSGSLKPFVGEVITTHHQEYYNGNQPEADEMESPIPNQQIATHGSFYFTVEGNIDEVEKNKVWLNFANQLLCQMLQQQGLGSKTASGYGYFEQDAALIEQIIDKHRKIKKQQEEDKIAAMSRYRQIIHKWQTHLESKEKYSVNNQAHSDFYKELVKDLQEVAQSTEMTKEEKAQIAEVLSIKKIQTKHPNWITKNRKNEIIPILDILRSNTP